MPFSLTHTGALRHRHGGETAGCGDKGVNCSGDIQLVVRVSPDSTDVLILSWPSGPGPLREGPAGAVSPWQRAIWREGRSRERW